MDSISGKAEEFVDNLKLEHPVLDDKKFVTYYIFDLNFDQTNLTSTDKIHLLLKSNGYIDQSNSTSRFNEHILEPLFSDLAGVEKSFKQLKVKKMVNPHAVLIDQNLSHLMSCNLEKAGIQSGMRNLLNIDSEYNVYVDLAMRLFPD